ncbi:arrestin domain-containing protein 3-like [Ictalurus furcatus]|uniref:arrestin domain-containing protein 3-like n=1 Tax=Ictalurus furcatus TaxID=66913 RepID=UPI002350596E|nr:arrestin domain-containing protein 3-like [Ictalurus furcatus]
MSGSIKAFSINYNPVNESNTFTNGDILQGTIVLQVSKEVKIDKLFVKCKGDANVHWTESNGTNNSDDSYSAHERYFKIKQILIWDNSKMEQNGDILVRHGETYKNLVMPGHHAFPFSFQLPRGNTPSSFKGSHGSITYALQARLSRSWKIPQTVTKEFTFVSTFHGNGSHLMRPLSGSVDKKLKLFTSGSVSIKASTDKEGYMQGERIKVETHIENSSSRALKLKFKLEQNQMFIAQSRHKHAAKVIFKAVEDPIPPRSKKTFTSRLKIPSNLDQTITDCNIIKVEYMLKVYLDVPYARDPEIIFPVVIIPAGQYSFPQPNQVDSYASQNRRESIGTGSAFQPAFVAFPPVPAATAFGPAPNVYPSVYTQPANPVEPPPSYTDIFPDSNPSASGFNPSLLPFSPPPYTVMGSSPAPHHHTPECPTPECPGAAGYWQSPANPDFYPTK